MVSHIKAMVKHSIIKLWPEAWEALNIIRGKKSKTTMSENPPKFTFQGWGMTTTTTNPPWVKGQDSIAHSFLQIHNEIIQRIQDQSFIQIESTLYKDIPSQIQFLNELMWRHFLVCWSVIYASQMTKLKQVNIAECGVCDGLTAFFAMNVLQKYDCSFKCYLYDSWEAMKSDYLVESELSKTGWYSDVSIARTRQNLKDFEEFTIFNQGFIPDSLETSTNPENLVWLHIDLNSSIPTKAALEFFFDKMPSGSVILLDDYAWTDFQDTRDIVDTFFEKRSGLFLHFPTGQGIFFKGTSI